jgi:hypothetical protein
MQTPINVHVPPIGAPRRLLEAVASHTGAAFVTEGVIAASLRLDARSPSLVQQAGKPTLECAGVSNQPERPTQRIEVRFADDRAVPWPFRGRTVTTGIPQNLAPLTPVAGERVLAGSPEGALWTARRVDGAEHFRSAVPLLDISENGSFAQAFAGTTFMANLPLLQLLAQLDPTGIGAPQPLRAGFMFDDPNLHWTSYGYLNYDHLLSQAERENFHVSFATIPLDGWFVNSKAAQHFSRNRHRLSLLVHGNNHTRHELAREKSASDCSALLQQARRRIERLERRAGVCVDRVMVPPHGACSETMLAALPGAGFEGACLSSGSLIAHNPGADWIRDLGYRPAERVLGCPVLPRWAMVGIDESEMFLAAYLGRPLILRGHHNDLRDGVDLLTELARFINGLGHVCWIDNAQTMRSSYRLNVAAGTARVCAYSNDVTLTLPVGIDALVFEPSEPHDTTASIVVAGAARAQTCLPNEAISLPPSALSETATTVRIRRAIPPLRPVVQPRRGLDTAAVLRRMLTEARDRLMPLASH